MNLKNYIRFFMAIGLLILFYFLGMRLELIIFLGIFMLLLLLFKTKLYKKIEPPFTELGGGFSTQDPPPFRQSKISKLL